VIVLASEEAHRALLGHTNPATLFAQLSFGPSRGFPGTTVLIAASSACQTAPHAPSLTNPTPLPTIAFRAGAEARNHRIGLARQVLAGDRIAGGRGGGWRACSTRCLVFGTKAWSAVRIGRFLLGEVEVHSDALIVDGQHSFSAGELCRGRVSQAPKGSRSAMSK
jgi:hypothetical protein